MTYNYIDKYGHIKYPYFQSDCVGAIGLYNTNYGEIFIDPYKYNLQDFPINSYVPFTIICYNENQKPKGISLNNITYSDGTISNLELMSWKFVRHDTYCDCIGSPFNEYIGTSIDDGYNNTKIMLEADCRPAIAAFNYKTVADKNEGNWYIPSCNELFVFFCD